MNDMPLSRRMTSRCQMMAYNQIIDFHRGCTTTLCRRVFCCLGITFRTYYNETIIIATWENWIKNNQSCWKSNTGLRNGKDYNNPLICCDRLQNYLLSISSSLDPFYNCSSFAPASAAQRTGYWEFHAEVFPWSTNTSDYYGFQVQTVAYRLAPSRVSEEFHFHLDYND